MTFIEPGCPVAPPFNIIPSIQNICEALKKLCYLCSKSRCRTVKKQQVRTSIPNVVMFVDVLNITKNTILKSNGITII